MQALRSIDAFRSVPKDLTEATLHGAMLTVCAAVLCVSLFTCELSSFLTVTTRTRIVMDSNQDKLLRINFDIHMHDLACDYVSVGVWDSFGSDRLNITRNIQKQRVDHEGKDKGHAYTDDELIELDFRDQALSDHEREELDSDWTSTSDNFKHNDFQSVVESHDFTFVLFYADWCPPCRAFKPTYNEFESTINDGKEKLKDSDGLLPNVRVLKINCVDFKQACVDESIQSFPTVRMYRRTLSSKQQYVAFEGQRSVPALMQWSRTEVARRHLRTGIEYHSIFKEGCRVRGSVEVTRVPGTLHIEARSTEERHLNYAFTNVSHTVHHLSFGDESPELAARLGGNWGRPLPVEYQRHIAPLDGRTFTVGKFHKAPHHYIKVVSTNFESWGQTRSYQITHQHREANIGRRDVPQAKFSYDLAPVEVIVTQERQKKWYDFITGALAIVGGTFTVLSLTSGMFNMASKAFKGNIGKLG
eukprot:TRINITY_DN15740_c0_g1_i1.p1 TRINITY_DN15740_c0_g1~~TRINITY_DN15740_c0_g1_i1.p1  ORF type:complete len:473 (+),score=171.29 TRINITY_DN15740_c0_g1_i1:64-1482(+)